MLYTLRSNLKLTVNALSLSRVLLAPLTTWCIVSESWLLASLLVLLAIATDVLDGYLARRYQVVSIVGGLLDHSSDALFVSSCLFALAYITTVPLLLPILVILAFLQYMFDSKALVGHELRSNKLGRSNGIAYFVLVCLGTMGPLLIPMPMLASMLMLFGWLLILTTLLSMLDRLQAFINLRSIK